MKTLQKDFTIPEQYRRGIETIYQTLTKAGFQAYMVGGSVRDWMLGIEASDFDFATNARPEQVMALFRRAIPTGIKHGTVTVLLYDVHYEITTYRSDGAYTDGRHPDSISFSDSLEEDVLRRDFTINGLAYDLGTGSVIDYVEGLADLERKTICTIGSPLERLGEDGLRSYRACRFASRFGYAIDKDTMDAITATLEVSARVSAERVRDELLKLLLTPKPSLGLELMRATGLLQQCLPELAECFGLSQNRFHMYDIYYHNIYSCDAAPVSQPMIRLAALLHDIGKTPTRRESTDGEHTFYNHEVIGARMVRNIMRRLKFSNEEIEQVQNLVYNHMFHYTDEWTDGAVRRFMRKVGVENMEDLIELRRADRQGNGSREGLPEPIRQLQRRIAKIIEDENAITVRDLRVNGNDLMNAFGLKPGPIIGQLLHELLELVLDDPELNEHDFLMQRATEILPGLPPDPRQNNHNSHS